jgi:hypothetical protein
VDVGDVVRPLAGVTFVGLRARETPTAGVSGRGSIGSVGMIEGIVEVAFTTRLLLVAAAEAEEQEATGGASPADRQIYWRSVRDAKKVLWNR